MIVSSVQLQTLFHYGAQSLGCVPLFATPWTVAHQAPLSIEFPRQEYWNGLPLLTPGVLPDPGIEPVSSTSLALAGRVYTTEPPGKLNTVSCVIHSVQFSCSVMFDSLQPHGQQHTRPPCPSPAPGVYSNSCPLSQLCHPTISSSAIPFSSCLQSFPVSGSFKMSQFFPSGSQSIGVLASASVLPMNIQD